jgi:Flp pilus assembly pilin Flp
MDQIINFLWDTSGASAVEYGLIVAVIGVGFITAMAQFATSLWDLFNAAAQQVLKA